MFEQLLELPSSVLTVLTWHDLSEAPLMTTLDNQVPGLLVRLTLSLTVCKTIQTASIWASSKGPKPWGSSIHTKHAASQDGQRRSTRGPRHLGSVLDRVKPSLAGDCKMLSC